MKMPEAQSLRDRLLKNRLDDSDERYRQYWLTLSDRDRELIFKPEQSNAYKATK